MIIMYNMRHKKFTRLLHDTLRIMNTAYIDKRYHSLWTPENPVIGYDYLLTELMYHLSKEKGITLYPHMLFLNNGDTHWFLKTDKNITIDYAKDRFHQEPNYSEAIPEKLLSIEMSERCKILLNLLNIISGRKNIIKKGEDYEN